MRFVYHQNSPQVPGLINLSLITEIFVVGRAPLGESFTHVDICAHFRPPGNSSSLTATLVSHVPFVDVVDAFQNLTDQIDEDLTVIDIRHWADEVEPDEEGAEE